MTGPNLLAWAKEMTEPFAMSAEWNLFSLSRAILADEEERKRIEQKNATVVSGVENTPTVASHVIIEPETPTE